MPIGGQQRPGPRKRSMVLVGGSGLGRRPDGVRGEPLKGDERRQNDHADTQQLPMARRSPQTATEGHGTLACLGPRNISHGVVVVASGLPRGCLADPGAVSTRPGAVADAPVSVGKPDLRPGAIELFPGAERAGVVAGPPGPLPARVAGFGDALSPGVGTGALPRALVGARDEDGAGLAGRCPAGLGVPGDVDLSRGGLARAGRRVCTGLPPGATWRLSARAAARAEGGSATWRPPSTAARTRGSALGSMPRG